MSNQKRMIDAIAALAAIVLFLCTFPTAASIGKQKEIAFIDSAVKDSQILADGVRPGVEVVMLDPQGDELAQIAKELRGRNSLDAVHIISHGSAGALQLGTRTLTVQTLDDLADDFTTIGHALKKGGDILLYGCNVATGSKGTAFVSALARATQANIAASIDLTGAAKLGGNWKLEATTGKIDNNVSIFDRSVDQYNYVLASIGSQITVDFNTDGAGWDTSIGSDLGSNSYTNNNFTFVYVDGYSTDIWGMGNQGSVNTPAIILSGGSDQTETLTITNASGNTFKFTSFYVNGLGWGHGVWTITGMRGGSTTGSQTIDTGPDGSGPGGGVATTFTLNANTNLENVDTIVISSQAAYGFNGVILDSFVFDPVVSNVAPTITNLNGDSVSYTEGGSAVALDQGGNATATEDVGWTGGKLLASFTSGQDFVADLLGINNQGAGAGQIGLSGSSITYGGTTIGTVGGGSGNLPLTVTFNSSATDAAITALLQNLTFKTTNNSTPSTTSRTVRVTLSDSVANVSSNNDITASVTAVNDPPTFNVGTGKVIFATSPGEELGYAVAMQPDGKLLVAGNVSDVIDPANWIYSENNLLLARFNPDGSLDTSFGSNGFTKMDIWTSDSVYETGISIAVLPDGKIVVGVGEPTTGNNQQKFGVARFNSDGTADTSFGTAGAASFSVGTENAASAHGMAMDAKGNILLVGESQWRVSGTVYQYTTVLRVKPDGTLDTTFGTSGIVTTNVGATTDYNYASGIAVQPDGKIVVVGTQAGAYLLTVLRYNDNGSLDTTFNSSGIATFNVASSYDGGTAVAVQSDGKIVVGGNGYNGSNNDFLVLRLTSTGTLDTEFNTTGKVILNLGADDTVKDVAVQSDGKILVSGASGGQTAFVRLNSNGSLDTTFDGDGKLVVAGSETGEAAVLQGDGRIVAVGSHPDPTWVYFDLAVDRFNADGTADGSFGAANTLNGTPSYTQGDPAVVLDNDVAVFDAELSGISFTGATLSLARDGGANANDHFSASGTLTALTEGGNLTVDGTVIGTVTTNSNGTLLLTFSANATQPLVDSAMRKIAYSNSIGSPASVQIDWTFSDGNTGSQGTGGALNANGSVTISITATGPTVTGILPTSGTTAGGTPVSITGTNLSGATSVTIGGTAATGVTVVNSTTITATTPAGSAGTADVAVTTPGGTGTGLFTYVAAPTVTSITPISGPTAGGTPVSITGTNLSGATSVTIGGTAATGVTVVNSTTITATTPAGSAGTADVAVTTPGGTGTGTGLFTYIAAPTATTNAASSITATDAILNGTVNANGTSTTVTFNYGLTTGYGSTAVAAQSPVTGSTNTAVSAAISELSCNTLYHFRVKGVSSGGTTNGLDATFTTGACLPNLTINDVSQSEGNTGTTTFTFTVSLSAPAGAGGVTFDIATADNTATQPSDYTAKSLTGQTIPAGSSTYSFDVLVNGDTTFETNETFFVNVTNVTGAVVVDGQGQGTIVNDEPQADLAITKTDGVTTATPGGSVTYTITASNAGPSNASGSTVSDTFPASLTCTWTCAGAGGGTCTASGSGNINDTVNLPSGGSVTYTASCTISAAATGTVANTATVAAPGGVTDLTPGNNSATDTDTLTPQADLAITKTDGVTTATPGGSVTYTITASNAGPSNASGSTVSDTFPASLTCTWTCVGAGGGACTASGAGNINDTANLPSGGSVTYTASCAISAAATGTIVNTATVTAPGGVTDPTPGNNSATDTDTLAAQADLTITKTDGVTTATPGGSTTYTITASNAGPSNASGSTVSDTFPASLTCTWTCVGAGGGTCTASGASNINDTANLPSGGSVTYTASCTISAAATGTIANTATVAAPGGVTDPTPGNNAATDTDTLAAPEINVKGNANTIADGDATPSLTDHTDFGSVAAASGTVVRTFTIENLGNASLTLNGTPTVAVSGAHAADFTVSAQPTSPVAALGTTTFQVTFNPSDVGTRSATLSINNDDSDETPYDFAIQGTGLNSAPTDITLSASAIDENVAANSTVGTLTSTDPDAGNTFTYTLVTGTGDTDNASFNISGSSLRITSSPNYEAKSSYSVRVRSSDQGSLTYEKAFTITINNVNEAPINTGLPVISGTNKVGGTLSVTSGTWTDADGDTLTYSYQWKAGGADIAGNTSSTLLVSSAQAKKTITCVVTANDGYGGTTPITSAEVLVANSAPVFTGTPTITGIIKVGNTLGLADTGTSDADGDTVALSYRWAVDGVDIPGANQETYILTANEAKKNITCTLTADDDNGGITQFTTRGVKSGFPWWILMPGLIAPKETP